MFLVELMVITKISAVARWRAGEQEVPNPRLRANGVKSIRLRDFKSVFRRDFVNGQCSEPNEMRDLDEDCSSQNVLSSFLFRLHTLDFNIMQHLVGIL